MGQGGSKVGEWLSPSGVLSPFPGLQDGAGY